MATPKQARNQGAAARGASNGSTAAKKSSGAAAKKKNNTRGGRPDAPTGGAARGQRDTTRPGQARPGQGRPRTPAGPASDAASSAEAPSTLRAPMWLQITTLVLSLGGLGDSIYLTIAHYTSTSILACSDKGTINCALVTTSPESIVFGIFPVAVLGLAFYVFMVAVNTPWAWQAKLPAIRWARLGSVIVGIGFVLYLVYTEVITLDHICLYCTYVHVITLLLFGLIVFSASAGYGVKPAADRQVKSRR
jgi:uncharacterized membrane protein